MAPGGYPAQSPKRQCVASWIALALALVFPLMVTLSALDIQMRHVGTGDNLVIESLVASIYTVFTCFVWPVPIVAIFLAGLVLKDARGRNTTAWVAAALGALPMLAVVAVLVAAR